MVGVSYYGTIQLAVAALAAAPPEGDHAAGTPPADFYREAHAPRRHPADVLLRALHALRARQRRSPTPRGARRRRSSRRSSSELTADPDLGMYTALWNIAANPARTRCSSTCSSNRSTGRSTGSARRTPSTTGSRSRSTRARPGGPTRTCTSRGLSPLRRHRRAAEALHREPVDEERRWRGYNAEVVRWYDHWLKGAATGIMDEPPIGPCARARMARRARVAARPHRVDAICTCAPDGGSGSRPSTGDPPPDEFTQPPLVEDHRGRRRSPTYRAARGAGSS